MSRLIHVRRLADDAWEWQIQPAGEWTRLMMSHGLSLVKVRHCFNADDDVQDVTPQPVVEPPASTTLKFLVARTGRVPTKATPGAAAYDVYADLGGEERRWVHPGEQEMFLAGFKMQLPVGTVALLLPRSGLGVKGLVLANGTGVIDSDYRGDVMVCLKNTGKNQHIIKHGDRICQMLITLALDLQMEVVETLDGTERGEGGFGSTGVAG